jgi:septal ring factor EnvC (AmiA/AmiB activator)
MDFDTLSVYSLSEWVNEVDKEIETIDTEIQKYSSTLHDAEATIRVCNANLDKLQSVRSSLRCEVNVYLLWKKRSMMQLRQLIGRM